MCVLNSPTPRARCPPRRCGPQNSPMPHLTSHHCGTPLPTPHHFSLCTRFMKPIFVGRPDGNEISWFFICDFLLGPALALCPHHPRRAQTGGCMILATGTCDQEGAGQARGRPGLLNRVVCTADADAQCGHCILRSVFTQVYLLKTMCNLRNHTYWLWCACIIACETAGAPLVTIASRGSNDEEDDAEEEEEVENSEESSSNTKVVRTSSMPVYARSVGTVTSS
jgi:hypothetical protein